MIKRTIKVFYRAFLTPFLSSNEAGLRRDYELDGQLCEDLQSCCYRPSFSSWGSHAGTNRRWRKRIRTIDGEAIREAINVRDTLRRNIVVELKQAATDWSPNFIHVNYCGRLRPVRKITGRRACFVCFGKEPRCLI